MTYTNYVILRSVVPDLQVSFSGIEEAGNWKSVHSLYGNKVHVFEFAGMGISDVCL